MRSVMIHKTCCEVTMHGLHEWYEHKFEKLGWMILAKSHGHTEKVREYKHSLQMLKKAIEHKMTHIHEMDRKQDLMIMHSNVMILIAHANKDL